MKSIGITRKIDELGRIVIPKETRETLSIQEGESLEVFKDDHQIILRKYEPGCVFCGSMSNILTFHGILVCEECGKEINGTICSADSKK